MGCLGCLTMWEEPTPALPCCLSLLWTQLPSGASKAARTATENILKGKKKKKEVGGDGMRKSGKRKSLSEPISPEHTAGEPALRVALSTFEMFDFIGERWYIERENKQLTVIA